MTRFLQSQTIKVALLERHHTYLEIGCIHEILNGVWDQVLIRPEDDGHREAKVDRAKHPEG
jgi:hypothetical protein